MQNVFTPVMLGDIQPDYAIDGWKEAVKDEAKRLLQKAGFDEYNTDELVKNILLKFDSDGVSVIFSDDSELTATFLQNFGIKTNPEHIECYIQGRGSYTFPEEISFYAYYTYIDNSEKQYLYSVCQSITEILRNICNELIAFGNSWIEDENRNELEKLSFRKFCKINRIATYLEYFNFEFADTEEQGYILIYDGGEFEKVYMKLPIQENIINHTDYLVFL